MDPEELFEIFLTPVGLVGDNDLFILLKLDRHIKISGILCLITLVWFNKPIAIRKFNRRHQ